MYIPRVLFVLCLFCRARWLWPELPDVCSAGALLALCCPLAGGIASVASSFPAERRRFLSSMLYEVSIDEIVPVQLEGARGDRESYDSSALAHLQSSHM